MLSHSKSLHHSNYYKTFVSLAHPPGYQATAPGWFYMYIGLSPGMQGATQYEVSLSWPRNSNPPRNIFHNEVHAEENMHLSLL